MPIDEWSQERADGQLTGRLERRHFVHFYGTDDETLARNVALFLADGLVRGDGLLVISSSAHADLIRRRLERPAAHARSATAADFVFLPARETLERITVRGQPDWALFESLLLCAVRAAQGEEPYRKVRVFGETVGLLWSEGRLSAAARLESFWNRLLVAQRLELYCAYPIDIFSGEFQLGPIDGVLCGHTHVVPTLAHGSLEEVLERGLRDVLGPRAVAVCKVMNEDFRPAWATLPPGEAKILWLRNHLPEQAERVLSRARWYYDQACASAHTLMPTS
ncbi:MAG TPA: MEDS domain-containing protein [Candidatus Acidoferrales bacterium]|nr:MEDS domain-containing protein [Candidatus Acidoferrales bacterium]